MASNNTDKYKFLSQPDDALKCVICLEVAEEPWQHGDCGRLVCKECLNKLGKRKRCPNCRMERPQFYPDNKSSREIRSLPVQCHNVERSCTWEGTVGTVEEHVATCQFTLLPCPKKCENDDNEIRLFMRKDLEHHLKEDCPNREYKCEYCGEEGTYAYITETHDQVCEKKIVPCINYPGCRKRMQRQHIFQHFESECEHTEIACKYKSIGCEMKMKRKDMPAHELDDTLHLHMAINTVTIMQEKITQLNTTTIRLEKTLNEKGDIVLKEGKTLQFRFVDYRERKENKIMYTSPYFYTSQGYHMALKVFANGHGHGEGSHVSVSIEIVEGKYDTQLNWPFAGNVTVTLLNQLKDEDHHSQQIKVAKKKNIRVRGYKVAPQFISHSALVYNPTKNTQYLKDDTLYFKVLLDQVQDNKPWLQCTANI